MAGAPSWRNPDIYRKLGLVPERPSVYGFLTGQEFVRATARLHQLPDPDRAADRAIGIVEMADAQHRRISTYSKGMRQRIKVAAALVHDPELLLLDEPFNGMDPRQRLHMMDLLEALGDEGRTILFSSHILEEVERLSGTIQVIVSGRLAASGDFRAIRRLMTSRPHVFLLHTSDDRRVGSALIGSPAVTGVEMTGRGLQVKASDYGAFSRRDRRAHPRPGRAAARPAARGRVAGERLRLPRRILKGPADVFSGPAGTVASITLRATMGRKRAFLFALPALILVLVTALLKIAHPAAPDWPSTILGDFGFAVVLPLTALIIGTSVLGAEIDDGSVVHLLATPVRRSTVILSKFAVGAVLTMIFVAVPELIAAVIATGGLTRLAEGLFVGALAGAVIYNAVFVMISVLTTRAIAVGLLYLLVWESLLGNFVAGRGSCPWGSTRWASRTRSRRTAT